MRPLTRNWLSPIPRESSESVRSSLIVVRVDFLWLVEPDVMPCDASHGRWLMNRPNSDTYVSRPALLFRCRPVPMLNLKTCDAIQRFVSSLLYSLAICHCSDGCGCVPLERKAGVPSGMKPFVIFHVGGRLISV